MLLNRSNLFSSLSHTSQTRLLQRSGLPRRSGLLGRTALVSAGLLALAGCSADAKTSTGNAPLMGGGTMTNDNGETVVTGGPSSSAQANNQQQDIIPVTQDENLSDGACANGVLNKNEACDDGNMMDGDGCSADCLTVEENYACGNDGNCVYIHVCGDGKQGPMEGCDDGNAMGGDGCSETCQVETDYACPSPGQPCSYAVSCGDGNAGGTEECDDGNTDAGDGCSDACTLEAGWTCSVPGAPCAPTCGDGTVVGKEDCDDGNMANGDGCSSTCTSELGWVCDTPGSACREAVCGDGVAEGGEPCDDGENTTLGDGCSPGCRLEPDCSAGECASRCGDGMILPADNEACDDGNTKPGDGCDENCQIEPGFDCEIVSANPGNVLTLPIVYRDLIGMGFQGGDDYMPPGYHPDFEVEDFGPEAGSDEALYGTKGIVDVALAPDGKPKYAASTAGAQACTTNAANFDQWFHDTPDVNMPLLGLIDLRQQNDGSYVFDSSDFFPLDGAGLVAAGKEKERVKDWLHLGCWDPIEQQHECGCSDPADCNADDDSIGPAACADTHNYSFTSEVRYWFEYQGGEKLIFRGDDDVFVFIKGRLVVDLGGLHEPLGGNVCGDTWGAVEVDANGDVVVMNGRGVEQQEPPGCNGLSDNTADTKGTSLGLVKGQVYEVAVFQAERHTCQSNYRLTLGGFTQNTTECKATCGDGVIAGGEACDDGPSNGMGYGFCTADCLPGPRCGDGIVDPDQEECDNGVNLSGYYETDSDCAPGCVYPPFCGDGNVDSAFNEVCDDGVLDGSYGGCDGQCQLGPHCGDGVIQQDQGELCDDGNRRNGDGCNVQCQVERIVMK